MSDEFELDLDMDDGSLSLDTDDSNQQGSLTLGMDWDAIPLDGTGSEFTIDFDDEDELVLGEEDNRDGFEDALALRSQIDVVDALLPYAQCTNELLTVLVPKEVTDEDLIVKYAVSRSEFPYMPEEIFRVFHNVLVDLAIKDQYQQYTPDQCLELSLMFLNQSAHWEPKLNREAYIESFLNWIKRFRKLAGTQGKADDNDLAVLIDMPSLEAANEVFTVNSAPFVKVNNFFSDLSTLPTTEVIDQRLYGELCTNYLSSRGLRALTAGDVASAIQQYFGSDDLATALHISQDELVTYSIGELLRRYLLFELNAGIFYPSGLLAQTDDYMALLGSVLYKCATSGSIAAEILCLLHTLMTMTGKRGMQRIVNEFMQDIYNFLMHYLKNSSYVSPVFCGNVVRQNGQYMFDYVGGDQTYNIDSGDILCSIVGTKYNLYCYPRVLFDDTHGYAICPAPALLTSLRAVARGGRLKVSGGMRFNFTPTIGWLIANKLLAEDKDQQEEETKTGISGEANTLLQTLLSYDNDFVQEQESASIKIVESDEYNRVVYAVTPPEGEEGYLISAITSRSEGQPGENIIGHDGRLVNVDDVTIAQYTGTDGRVQESVIRTDTIKARDTSNISEDDDGTIAIDDLLLAGASVTEKDYSSYERAVRQLCEMGTLDYEEELEYVQRVIACDLFYALGIPVMDSMLASRVLNSYRQVLQRDGAIDSFNFNSLQELTDLLVGVPNQLTDAKEWKPEFADYLNNDLVQCSIDIHTACERFDKLNIDLLATQVFSVSRISRVVETNMYMALRQVPGIGSRFHMLENKMIVLRVFNLLGDASIAVFDKFTPLVKAYGEEITVKTVDAMHYTLKEKMSRKIKLGDTYSLPLVKRIVEEEYNPDAVILKYFILERDIYSLISTLQNYGDKYKAISSGLLTSIGMPETTQVAKVSTKEFNKQVTRDDVERAFFENRDQLMTLLLSGFVSEVVAEGYFPAVRAYDLFNTFYTVLINLSGKGKVDMSMDDLYDYGASFVLSYCPAFNAGANAVDGGDDRITAFVANPSDFFYDGDLQKMRQRDVNDMRIITGW